MGTDDMKMTGGVYGGEEKQTQIDESLAKQLQRSIERNSQLVNELEKLHVAINNAKFKFGERVDKAKGYMFPGTVRAVMLNGAGATRYVVEHDCGDLLHIFNEEQLKKRGE